MMITASDCLTGVPPSSHKMSIHDVKIYQHHLPAAQRGRRGENLSSLMSSLCNFKRPSFPFISGVNLSTL